MPGFTKGLGSIRRWLAIMTNQPLEAVCSNRISMIEVSGIFGAVVLAKNEWIISGWVLGVIIVALAWIEGAKGWGSNITR
jgi:hypothetical protein